MTKTADLSILIRDPEGNIIGNQNAIGITDDDGVTVVIPLGYLMDIQNVPLSDLTFNVIAPAVPKTPTAVVSRVDDVENNISTVVFGYE